MLLNGLIALLPGRSQSSMTSSHPFSSGWLRHLPTCLLFSEHLRVVGKRLQDEVQAGPFPPDFADLMAHALRQPGRLLASPVVQGKLLGSRELRGWSLPPLLMAVAAAGADEASLADLPVPIWQRATAVATAAEFLGAALDVIDDVQDGDNPWVEQIGPGQAVLVGLALLQLAPLALRQARENGWSDVITNAALELFHRQILISLSGQYLDLHFEHVSAVEEAQVMEMTQKKSATLIALIYRLGALAGVATEQERSPAYFQTISNFGEHLGLWLQLLNDLRDAEQTQIAPRKSDRQRHKKTLPLILESRGMIEAETGLPDTPGEAAKFQAALSYTYVAAETSRLRACLVLQQLEAQFGTHSLLWPLTG
jgi:geranylgeranyl pyrophosphate synthase